MSSAAKKIMQAAAGAGGGQAAGNYIAISSNGRVTILDHTSPGSLAFASSVTSGFSSGAHPRGIRFSPDGNYIAVAQVSGDQDVTLLNSTNPGAVSVSATYKCDNNGNTVDFGPDGVDYIAVGHATFGTSGDNFTLINNSTASSMSYSDSYRLGSGSTGSNLPRGSGVSFSPDGNYIAAGCGGFNSSPDFTLLSRSGGSVSRSSDFSGVGNNATAVAFSPDGNYIAVGSETSPFFKLLSRSGGSVSLADTYTTANYIIGKTAISWSPDGNYIAVAHWDSPYFTLLDHTSAGSVSLAATYTLGGNGYGTAFHPEGNYIAITRSGSSIFTLLNHSSGSVSLAATYTLASAVDEGGCDFSPN